MSAYRSRLQPGEDVLHPDTWAGRIPHTGGIAPRLRFGRDRWFNVLWLHPIGFVVLITAVAIAKGLHNVAAVEDFMARYPGTTAPTGREAGRGIPAWVGWQHFFNLFLMIFIRWVIFYSLAEGSDGGTYYDAHAIEQMNHHLTMLAYDMNDAPLTYGHGAPLRLRNELQHGFKHVKWVDAIEFVTHFREVGGGYGGYNEDHEYYGYRQSL